MDEIARDLKINARCIGVGALVKAAKKRFDQDKIGECNRRNGCF